MALLFIAYAAHGHDDDNDDGVLRGRYAVVGTGICNRSSLGFRTDVEFAPVVAAGATIQAQSFTYTGIRTFTRHGAAHGTITVYSLFHPAPLVGGGISVGFGNVIDFAQEFTYTVDSDRTLTLVPTSGTGTVTQGTALGSATSTVGAPPLAGRISRGSHVIVLTNAQMVVEHSINMPPGGVATDTPRVCTRTETLTKLAD